MKKKVLIDRSAVCVDFKIVVSQLVSQKRYKNKVAIALKLIWKWKRKLAG